MTVEEIIKKIKQEVKNKSKDESTNTEYINQESSPSSYNTQNIQETPLYTYAKKIGKYLQKKGLASFVSFIKRNLNLQRYSYTYNIDDFMQFEGELFIDNAYRIILNREADIASKYNYKTKLENNTITKKDIIISLYFSKEGKNSKIKIKNSKRLYILSKLKKIPLLGYTLRTFYMLIRLPKLIAQIEQTQIYNQKQTTQILNTKASTSDIKNLKTELNFINEESTKIEKLLNEESTRIEKLLHEEIIKINLGYKTLQRDMKLNLSSLNNSKQYIINIENDITNLIEEANKRLPNTLFNESEILSIVKEKDKSFDSFYVSFEDEFRGTKEDIKNKVKIYLPFVNKISEIKSDIKILDLGCGRGEWLELLKNDGYTNAKGIDLNSVMVSHSKKINLDVEEVDAVAYLKSLDNESLSIVTGFHILEHLPFEVLMSVFKESLRVLKKGGMIIFETPNPRNILVGSSDFYLDPTHINPIHPLTLKFIAKEVGFSNAKSYILDDEKLSDFDTLKFDNINDFINIGRDLSVIAYKQ